MESLVEAYLLCALHDDGESHPSPPPPSDVSRTFEIEVVDAFCEFYVLNTLSSSN
jgi:hypothetical protein